MLMIGAWELVKFRWSTCKASVSIAKNNVVQLHFFQNSSMSTSFSSNSADGVKITKHTILAKDNFPLIATLFTPARDSNSDGSTRRQTAVIVGSATGVRQLYYENYALYLCENGCPTLTFDFRGIGESLNGASSAKKYGSCVVAKMFQLLSAFEKLQSWSFQDSLRKTRLFCHRWLDARAISQPRSCHRWTQSRRSSGWHVTQQTSYQTLYYCFVSKCILAFFTKLASRNLLPISVGGCGSCTDTHFWLFSWKTIAAAWRYPQWCSFGVGVVESSSWVHVLQARNQSWIC